MSVELCVKNHLLDFRMVISVSLTWRKLIQSKPQPRFMIACTKFANLSQTRESMGHPIIYLHSLPWQRVSPISRFYWTWGQRNGSGCRFIMTYLRACSSRLRRCVKSQAMDCHETHASRASDELCGEVPCGGKTYLLALFRRFDDSSPSKYTHSMREESLQPSDSGCNK